MAQCGIHELVTVSSFVLEALGEISSQPINAACAGHVQLLLGEWARTDNLPRLTHGVIGDPAHLRNWDLVLTIYQGIKKTEKAKKIGVVY